MLNYIEARKEMRELFLTRFNNFWTNGIPNESIDPPQFKERGEAVDTYVPEIRWQNIEKKEKPNPKQHWLRFTSQNIRKPQTSLAGGRVDDAGTTHTTFGIVTVELYFSKTSYQNKDEELLTLIVDRCFSQASTRGGLWFRNSVPVELPPEENHFRSNVLAEYRYDTVIT